MSKEITAEEARENFIATVKTIAKAWAMKGEDFSLRDRCDGVAFSILSMIDGSSSMPAIDLVLRPHTGEKQFRIGEGDDFYVDGQVINSGVTLHDLFYREDQPVDKEKEEREKWLYEKCVDFLKYGTGGCKYPSASAWRLEDEEDYALWKPAEALGLIDTVGSYKWKLKPSVKNDVEAAYGEYARKMVKILLKGREDSRG